MSPATQRVERVKEGWGATGEGEDSNKTTKNSVIFLLSVLPTEQYIKLYQLDPPKTLEITILNKVVILHSYL
jgi:hypothetical protein